MKKEYLLCLLLISMSVGLSGCTHGPKSLFTDSGADVAAEVDTSQYLDLSVLEKDPQEVPDSWNGYAVYTVTLGTFETNIAGIKAELDMIETSQVKVEFSSGTMQLLELLVNRYTYLEKGDVIARVTMETNTIDLEELERKLSRLEADYLEYQTDYAERHEEAVSNISVYELPGKEDCLEIEQMERDNARSVENYEKQIADYKERITEFKNNSATEEIIATESGFVLDVSRLQVGQELSNGDVICVIAPADKLMLQFADETKHYGYGMDLTLLVGNNREQTSYPVQAVSALGKTLYGNWNQTTTRISGEYDIAQLLEQGPFTITGTTNVMKNVPLVPVEAVTVDGERCYVTVRKADGTLEKKQFIPGGQNKDYYWVFDGLEQGTQIIFEN